MTLEHTKKPLNVVLESGKPKRADQTEPKPAFVPLTGAQLQRARAKFEQGNAALQGSALHSSLPSSQHLLDPQAAPVIQAKQQAFHSSFVKPAVQRRALERIKTQSIETSSLRSQYQAAIVPEIVERLALERTLSQTTEARALQQPNALNASTDWFNNQLPALRARHNNPDQPDNDNASVFAQSNARARDLGKTYVAQRVSSGLTANDAASAIVNIGRSRDRNNALKGLLSAIRPQDSDFARIQRLVAEKEHDLELQRRATEEAVIPAAMQLAKEAAYPMQANSGISEKIKAKLGGGNPLPDHIRGQLEAGLNANLSRVRVHTDSEADTLAKSVHAIAFTSGQDIFFQTGRYEPNTKTGYELLAHEVTHTVQQANGQVQAGIDSDPSLETAAQNSGAKLAANFDPKSKAILSIKPAANSSSSVGQIPVQRFSDTSQLGVPQGTPQQIPGINPVIPAVPQIPVTTETRVVGNQQAVPKASTPAKTPIKSKAPKPQSKLKVPKSMRVKASTPKLPAALLKKPVIPKANKLEFADLKPSKLSAPKTFKANVQTGNIAFAPIPNLDTAKPNDKAKFLKEQAESTKAANVTLQNLRKQASSLEPHGAKISTQITKAASAAKAQVNQAGSQQKSLVNTQITALIASARSKGQANIAKSNSAARTKIAALPGITNTAKQAITSSHQTQIQALKTKLEAQRAKIAAKYDANKSHYETAAQTAGGTAKGVAGAKAETWRGQKTHESWWSKTKSYADFGAGPHPNDVLDAKADADIQTGDGYASAEGYPKEALKAFEASKQGIEQDFQNFKTQIHDPLAKALDSRKDNALKQLQSSEASTKQQIEQTRAQMESAMKAQLDGVLQQLTGQKTSLSATIDAIIKQTNSGIDTQSSSQIKGIQNALKTAATGIQSSISTLETQMSGKNAPKPEVLKAILGQIERSIGGTLRQTLAQTSKTASGSTAEFNSIAKTSLEGMRSSTQQGIQTAKQSEQQLIQSLAQLVQSATSAYTKFQTSHKTTASKTQADTIAEFTKILLSSDTAFQTALEQLATNLETAATQYAQGLVAHANGPDFQAALTAAEAKAAADVQPRWKGLLKILLIIVVVVVIALVIGPAVIGAVGAFAATLGAGAAAGAIGAIVGGAIVGALSGAVIQMGNNAIDGKAIFDGVGQAMVIGAISGAIGGGLGFAFSSGANAAATSSRAFLQTIGTKANSFAGKMVLDQLNGVVSGQFSSLLTTGKFQSFKELIQDPSTWIGFATSAATTRGGGPSRVNADAPNAPRVNVDAPNAPRVNTDTPTPRVDTDVPKPSRLERVQNRIEGIQERAFAAGERFGQDLGVRTTQGLGSKTNISVKTNTNLEPGQQRINTNEGGAKVEIGNNSHPGDVKAHQDAATQHILENGPIARIRQRLGLNEETQAPPGSKAKQYETEALKHETMADWRFAESERQAKLGNKAQADRLLQEAHDLREAGYDYLNQSRDPKFRNQPGDGEIDGGKRIYNNHDEIKDLTGKPFDKTKIPDGYTTFEIEGRRKIVAKVKADGTIDIGKAVLLVNEKGNVSVNPQNRVSYDYINIYKNGTNARSGISFGRDGYTVHHMITDKVSTGHPLTVKAMELIGFNVDTPINYAAMPMKEQFFKLDGTEVGHWSSHPEFDTRVEVQLTRIQEKLEGDFGNISTWSTHSERAKIATELRQEILTLQNNIFNDIQNGQVPMTNENTTGVLGRIN